MTMRWNVGFVGFGFIGRVHALAYRSLPFYYDRVPGEFRFAKVATSRAETAEAAKASCGFDGATTDWREVIDDPSIEIVHIAHPNVYHREVLVAAMDAGKHIYCEKPLAATWADALAVAEKIESYRRRATSQMCLQNRFFAATLAAARLARDGFLGTILSFRGAYLHSGIVDAAKPLNWKATVEYGGGGVILDLGPHLLDLVGLLCGEVCEVLAEKRISFAEREVRVAGAPAGRPTAEDHAVMLLRLAGGSAGSAEVSKVATGAQDELSLTVHGTDGALNFDLMAPGTLRVFEGRRPDRGWQHLPTGGNYPEKGGIPGKMAVGWVRAHVASLYNFVSAVARGEQASPDLADGVRLQGVLEAAYRSAAAKRWERVPQRGGG